MLQQALSVGPPNHQINSQFIGLAQNLCRGFHSTTSMDATRPRHSGSFTNSLSQKISNSVKACHLQNSERFSADSVYLADIFYFNEKYKNVLSGTKNQTTLILELSGSLIWNLQSMLHYCFNDLNH